MNFAHAMDLVGCRFSHIPLPLVTLAALTPADVSVSIVDENVEPVDLDLDADVIAMTGIYCQRARLFELADAFRARGRRVAIGGPIAADLPDDCRAHADTVFFGEAEYTWPRFVGDLQRGEPLAEYRQDGYIDMADSPVPRFELLKVERYSSACVQATRGCPYRCEFCDVPSKHGARPRSKPIAQVLVEVERLVSLGFDSIFFVDDHFAGNRKYARDLLIALAERVPHLPGPVYFYTQVTLNIARDTELLELFHAASFRRFFIGVESHDPAKLRAMTKPQNLEMDPREAIETIQRHNITVWAGIILGLDGDDQAALDAQFRFIMDTSITPTLIGLLQAMPGAPLHERVVREGRLRVLPDVVGSAAFGGPSAQGLTNLEPLGMPLPSLMRGFGAFVERVFQPDAYGQRIVAALRRGNRSYPPVRQALTRRNLMIVWRTLEYYARCGDTQVQRMAVRIMGEVLRRRGRGLEEALFHLVIYKHLRQFYARAADISRAAA